MRELDGGGRGDGEEGASSAAATQAARGWRSPVLCLWALELDLQHPVTGDRLRLELEEPGIYEAVRRELGGGGAGGRQR